MNDNKITQEIIEDLILEKVFIRAHEKTTICCLKLKNGFEVTGTSACVDVKNFDSEIGKQIAEEEAKNKIWELEGYRLQCDLYREKIKEKIFVLINGEYEDKEIVMVTDNLDKVCQHWIDYKIISRNIEIWNNEVFICNYGNLMEHIVNIKENITFEELKKDILKFIPDKKSLI